MTDLSKYELEDLCGQLLCLDVTEKDDPAEMEKIIAKMKPGGIFIANMKPETIKLYRDMANRYTKFPCIVTADVEYGPGSAIKGYPRLSHPMAWGATDDEELIEEAGYLTARIAKEAGVDYTLSPLVDLNRNFNNPVVSVRSISDRVERVTKIAGAYYRGMRRGGLTAACKHFPGDGMDDRNQHFCTTVNSLPFDEWMETYGKAFGDMIRDGIESVMVAHIALPSFDDTCDDLGYLPGVLSKKLMVDLLREKLGFDGCVVSDAMSMIGACSRLPGDRLGPEFIRCGGDFLLFPDDDDCEHLVNAVKNGILSRERVEDAVRRVLKLKEQSGLSLDGTPAAPLEKLEDAGKRIDDIGNKIGDESIKTIRDRYGVIEKGLKKGERVLLICLHGESQRKSDSEGAFDALADELRAHGCEVDSFINLHHTKIKEIIDSYDHVIVVSKFTPSEHCCGSSLRMGWENMMTFWRGYVLVPEKLIFASFGNPYAIYEMPYLGTYINTFSTAEFSQRALVRRLFGEIKETAKNPISLPGYFEYEA